MDSFDPRSGDDDARLIVGAKSSSGGGKSGGSASVEKDSLFTTATVRIVDLLGEGDIGGIVGGLQGIYLNDVPIQNPDGSFNYKGISVETRTGAPDQPYMPGFPSVETPTEVGTKVTQQLPAVAAISNVNANRARVTIQIPALLIAKTDGSVRSNSVVYRIEVRYSGGPWILAIPDQTVTGKASSPFYPSHEFALPISASGASAPWQIRVSRLSPDTDGFNASQDKFTVQSDTIFQTVTEIVDAKFTYPHTAVVGIAADVSIFGTSMPTRKYLVDGISMPIPNNYDPVARTYSGIWDGTFKMGVSDNPAWAFYLILQDDRFGLGEFIDPDVIDKWSLYQIAAYCDGGVPDGAGGYEPRFRFNGVISDQHDAFDLLEMIAQIVRGMAFWSSGAVTATQDRPSDPVLLVGPSNVLDEDGFSYASSSRRARHTVAIVGWSDPTDLYRVNYEVVEDGDGIARYGYNPTKVDLIGCTSRGQAHRAGLWALFSDLHETQVVTYKAGLDHAVIRPGDIVAVQDPQIAGIDTSGRVLAGADTSTIRLDRPVTFIGGPGVRYTISVMMPVGGVEERDIYWSPGTNTDTVTLLSPLPYIPDAGAVWVLAGGVVPQLFRVISIKEVEPHIFEVRALQHEPGKYATIDEGAPFVPLPISQLTKTVKPPVNLAVREAVYHELGVPKQTLTLSWTVGDALVTVGYRVMAIKPDGAVITLPQRGSTTADFTDAQSGKWTFFVTAIGITGATSEAATLEYECLGWASAPTVKVINLQVKGGGKIFTGRSCSLEWANQFPPSLAPYPVQNVVLIQDAQTQAPLHREVLTAGVTAWTYDFEQNVNDGGPRRTFLVTVGALSVSGVEGGHATIQASNPAPDKLTPTFLTVTENIFVYVNRPPDLDYEGFLTYVSTKPGVNPATITPYDSGFSQQILPAVPETTYYIRVAGYDAFGKYDLNISDEFAVRATIKIFKPTLSTAVEIDADGKVTAVVKAIWTQDTSSELGRYEVAVAESDASTPEQNKGYVFEGVDKASWEKHGLTPGRTISVKVRAGNKAGYVSGYSEVATIVAAANLTPPAPVTALKATGGYDTGFVSWTASTSRDVDFVEVWGVDGVVTTATPPSAATLLGKVASRSTSYQDAALKDAGKRTYWARPVNVSGVPATAFAGPASATSATITANEIRDGVITATKFAAGIAVTTIVDTLPTTKTTAFVTLTSDGKLYRWDDTAKKYTSAVDAGAVQAENIVGQIDSTQIEDGSITTPKLVAGSVTTNILAASAVVADNIAANAITTAKISAGAIKAAQIDTGAITTDKLGANVVSADKIAANSISSYHIIAGSIYAEDIAANTITGDKIAANTITAQNLSVGAISADTISVGNGTLTTLFNGGNITKINGGAIQANTITGNLLKIGSRQVQLVGISFGAERDGNGNLTGYFYWTAGSVLIEGDDGQPQSYNIPYSRVGFDNRYWYVWWNKASPANFSYGPDAWDQVYRDSNCVLLATISSLTGISVMVGGTIIDGTRITTRSIQADQIAANAIQAIHIAANTITADKLAAGSITANSIGTGTLSAAAIYVGSIRTVIQGDVTGGFFGCVNNEGNAWRVALGHLQNWTQSGDYGLLCWDGSNALQMKIASTGAYLNGAIIGAATIGSAQIGYAAITNAKIGNLEVDYLKINNGAISNIGANYSGGKLAQIQMYSRGPASLFVITGYRAGDGNSRYQLYEDGGTLRIQYSYDGYNFGDLVAIVNPTVYQFDRQLQANYKMPQAASLCCVWQPGGPTTIYLRCVDTSGMAYANGVAIWAMEVAR